MKTIVLHPRETNEEANLRRQTKTRRRSRVIQVEPTICHASLVLQKDESITVYVDSKMVRVRCDEDGRLKLVIDTDKSLYSKEHHDLGTTLSSDR